MILSVATSRLSSRIAQRTLYIIRSASVSSAKDHAPEPATIQITTQDFPGKVPSGHFKYDRFDRYSWDNRFKGNEWTKLLFKDIEHHAVIQALWVCGAVWLVGFLYTVYISFDKIEIWMDRKSTNEFGERTSAWDWEKVRDNYWKRSTVMYDKSGGMRNRLPMMEAIQDEMLEELKRKKRNGEIKDD
uniref:Uncharacterized protein n=1 Tax=Acrobeloides nanus TaxID=290746 RepID=A0A914DLJ9_9BILA